MTNEEQEEGILEVILEGIIHKKPAKGISDELDAKGYDSVLQAKVMIQVIQLGLQARKDVSNL